MGTGSAFAHRAVDGLMGGRETRVVHENAPEGAPAASPASAPMMHQQVCVCVRVCAHPSLYVGVCACVLLDSFSHART